MLKINIIGKDKIFYEGEADAVFVPSQTGIIEVLPMHMDLVSGLTKGDIILKTQGNENKFPILGGVLEVHDGKNVIILVS